MPRYNYECKNCGTKIEIVHSIKLNRTSKSCPKCGKRRLRKLISNNISIIFKGDGFYRSVNYINQKAKETGTIHGGRPGVHGRGDGE